MMWYKYTSSKVREKKVFVCYIIYPMQSLNLQILEKRSQKFDGVVGQDYWQNAKPLVTKEKSKTKRN